MSAPTPNRPPQIDRQIPDVSERKRVDVEMHVRMLSRQQPARMEAEREDFLAHALGAAVEGRPCRHAQIPFEQIAVQVADQELPVLAPGERCGERRASRPRR